MSEHILIDGSHGEGGGQIIRTSVSLAAITGKAVEVVNVRAGRAKPGLQAQHLTAVRAAAEICAAELDGAEQGSTRFMFRPQTVVNPGKYRFDIGTAGATTLVAQTVLVPLSLAASGSEVVVTGGTHVPNAPPADFVAEVYLAVLNGRGFGASMEYSPGFFPRGGGTVTLEIGAPAAIEPLDLAERGKLQSLTATILTANLPAHVAERGEATVRQYMKGVGRQIEVIRREEEGFSPGAAVMLVAECENGWAGFTAVGERGKPMEAVAEAPCEQFMRWWKSGAAVDERLSDQLVLPMALAAGESVWSTPRVTEHLRTVLWVTEQFLPIRYSIEEREGGGLVRLTGIES